MTADNLYGRSILSMQDLSARDITLILDKAMTMKKIMNREVKKEELLKGKSVVTLFFENSTRTRTSFELAGKYLGADVINMSVATSSVAKGESYRDTLETIRAMHVDAIVIRHSAEGSSHYADQAVEAVILNAGDGAHQHPTQCLLDLCTIREHKKEIRGLKVAILGDARHSRVARSDIMGLITMGASVHLAGPKTLVPRELESLGAVIHEQVEDALADADVVYVLRIQLERQKSGLFPSGREYAKLFGLNKQRLALAKQDALVMHPGPTNRGLEISSEVAYCSQSVITQQVENGVAVRMALLALTLSGGEEHEVVA